MSRMPRVPPANRPTRGPDALERTSKPVPRRKRRKSVLRRSSRPRSEATSLKLSWLDLGLACAAGYALGWFVATEQ